MPTKKNVKAILVVLEKEDQEKKRLTSLLDKLNLEKAIKEELKANVFSFINISTTARIIQHLS